MTRLEGARSEQVATVTPSPPAVSHSNGGTAAGGAAPVRPVQEITPHDTAKPPVASPQEVKTAARQIESYLKSIGRQLEFRVDENSGRTVITVKDSSTGEVIRQIPGEESLRLAKALGGQSHALVDLEV